MLQAGTRMSQKFCKYEAQFGNYECIFLGQKVMNHTGLWDTNLARFSPSIYQRICLYD